MDIKIDVSWFRFLADLPPDEIKKVVRAIWDYTHGDKNAASDSAAWETIKANIDAEIQRKKEISEKRRAAILARWNRVNTNPQPIAAEPAPQPEVITPEIVGKSPFEILTDDLTILTALRNSESGLSVFLATGAGYDELSSTEREFADRGDVRAMCPWHKEIKEATKAVRRKPFTPPTMDEWLDFCREKNLNLEKMRNAYESYSAADWHDSQGNPIRNWKTKILQVWAMRPDNYNTRTANFGRKTALDEFATGAEIGRELLKKQGIIQ